MRTKHALVDILFMVEKMLIISEGDKGNCAYCGTYAELKPYGKDGANICHPCGMKPENIETTKMMYNRFLDGETIINKEQNN